MWTAFIYLSICLSLNKLTADVHTLNIQYYICIFKKHIKSVVIIFNYVKRALNVWLMM